jgi:hypothetical protein
MPSTIRRQIFLDHGRVQIDLPRLMTDEQLATVLEEFVKEVRARPRKESPPVSQTEPSRLPAKMKPPKRWR